MGLMQIHLMSTYSIAVVLFVALTHVSGDDIILQKKSDRNRLDVDRFVVDDRPRKRPFCNAFTGCGKKRSDESMATLVELNSEPAVEELNKQILSEAKLWEAIQEARAEVERQREERQNMISRSLPLALAMSNYRRKRAVRPLEEKAVSKNLQGCLGTDKGFSGDRNEPTRSPPQGKDNDTEHRDIGGAAANDRKPNL